MNYRWSWLARFVPYHFHCTTIGRIRSCNWQLQETFSDLRKTNKQTNKKNMIWFHTYDTTLSSPWWQDLTFSLSFGSRKTRLQTNWVCGYSESLYVIIVSTFMDNFYHKFVELEVCLNPTREKKVRNVMKDVMSRLSLGLHWCYFKWKAQFWGKKKETCANIVAKLT